jgi:putative transcriptional regulator
MKTTTRNNTKKTGRNGPSIGALAIEALTEAVAFMGGAKTGATIRKVTARRATAEPAREFEAQQIAKLRKQLRLSQPVFAEALNVSPASVRAWEQGMNTPGGAALRLLEIAEAHPEVILERVGAR